MNQLEVAVIAATIELVVVVALTKLHKNDVSTEQPLKNDLQEEKQEWNGGAGGGGNSFDSGGSIGKLPLQYSTMQHKSQWAVTRSAGEVPTGEKKVIINQRWWGWQHFRAMHWVVQQNASQQPKQKDNNQLRW